MIKDFEKLFDCKVKYQQWEPLNLPNYIVYGRTFYELDIEGVEFIVVSISFEDKSDIRSLKSQVKRIKDFSGKWVVLCFPSIKKIQMEALIRNKIPFIVPGEQIYVPFLGLALSNKFHDEVQTTVSFLPSAQMLFLKLLYEENESGILKKDAAEFLGLTRTSITRASKQLLDLGLITEERDGVSIYITPVESGYNYYIKAKPYLISPVQSKVLISKDVDISTFVVAGESALSEYSMLSEPRITSYACDKALLKSFEAKILDERWQSDMDAIQIECWKYEPKLFAQNGIIDPVSLACSFKDNKDERIEGEIEKMLEEYKW